MPYRTRDRSGGHRTSGALSRIHEHLPRRPPIGSTHLPVSANTGSDLRLPGLFEIMFSAPGGRTRRTLLRPAGRRISHKRHLTTTPGKLMGLKPRILIADDEPVTLELIVERLQAEGDEVELVSGGKQAIEAAKKSSFKVVLTDLSMPDLDGMEVLAHFSTQHPETLVIVLTGFGTVETAVEAMKRRRLRLPLSKPANPEELILTLKRAVEHKELKEENVALRSQIQEQSRVGRLIGQSPPMQQLYRIIKRVAKTDSTVLVTGESGTGKELIANAIHYQSSRSEMPFVPINFGAIPEDSLKANFSDTKKGLYRRIQGKARPIRTGQQGDGLLDEIGEMSPKLQVKLLRFLQETKFQRIGGFQDN